MSVEDYSDFEDDLLETFRVEAAEHARSLESLILKLENEPSQSASLIEAIFRSIHSLKGCAGFLETAELEDVCHVAESRLLEIVEGRKGIDSTDVDSLLEFSDKISSLMGLASYHSLGESESTGPEVEVPYPDDLEELSAQLLRELEPDPSFSPSSLAEPPDAPVKVRVGVLNELMNLAGELLVARNQLKEVRRSGKALPAKLFRQIDRLAGRLQDRVSETRRERFGSIFDGFSRLVRELRSVTGKKVTISFEGGETELDRELLEVLRVALVHTIRNSVDHGIEKSEEREALGKPSEGRLILRSHYDDDEVVVEVADDGKGIDPEEVALKALRDGLISPGEYQAMSESAKVQLICRPGFSTAREVTNLSGRGVGMDVLVSEVEGRGGSVEIATSSGQGTVVKCRLPRSSFISAVLKVIVDDQPFLLNQSHVQEFVWLDGRQSDAFETIDGKTYYKHGRDVLPIWELGDILGIQGKEKQYLLLIKVGDSRFGLFVEEVLSFEKVVVKPLHMGLHGLELYSGTAVMGSGRIALILDLAAIARRYLLNRKPVSSSLEDMKPREKPSSRYLIVVCDGEQLAIPLSGLKRMEELDPEKVYRVASRTIVEIRKERVSLYDWRGPVRSLSFDGEGSFKVLRFHYELEEVGLVVEKVVDIVKTNETIQPFGSLAPTGILGTLFLEGRLTSVFDFKQILTHLESAKGVA